MFLILYFNLVTTYEHSSFVNWTFILVFYNVVLSVRTKYYISCEHTSFVNWTCIFVFYNLFLSVCTKYLYASVESSITFIFVFICFYYFLVQPAQM